MLASQLFLSNFKSEINFKSSFQRAARTVHSAALAGKQSQRLS
jgi:hypothetical protein